MPLVGKTDSGRLVSSRLVGGQVDAAFSLDLAPEALGSPNGRTYRSNALTSIDLAGTVYQAHIYWNVDGIAVLQVRSDTGAGFGDWTSYGYTGAGGLPEISLSEFGDHHVINIGLDKLGYIHVAYDHSNDPLNYRKSVNPISTFDGAFSAETGMVGTNETSVTYVRFFNAPADGTLYAMFRAGGAEGGRIHLYKYDETTGWAAAPGTGTGGVLLAQPADADTAYFYAPGFDPTFPTSGFMHFAWHWRNDGGVSNSNRDVCYTKYDGADFFQADGTPQTVPIDTTNDEVVDAVAVSSGLGGQGNVAPDDDGNPHIVYTKDNPSGKLQIYHVWHNGTAWQTPLALTSQTTVNHHGDPETHLWRSPHISIDPSNGFAIVLYTLFAKVGVWALKSANYLSWVEEQVDTDAVGRWSVNVDEWQWQNNGILYLPVQPDDRANYEIVVYTPVADVTAPVLSSAFDTATGSTTANVGATTDEGNGVLYAVSSAALPSAAQIKAGQDSTGAAATIAVSQAVSAPGVRTIPVTGLTAATAYDPIRFMQEDVYGHQSNVVSGDGFTTESAGGYEAESETIFAAFTTPPDDTRKGVIDDLVVAHKASGAWAALDVKYYFAAADSQAALINWKSPGTFDAIAVNSPTFTADRGFTGDGSTSRVDTGFTPSTDGVQYVQDDASGWVWNGTDQQDNNSIFGNTTAPRIHSIPRNTSDISQGRANDNTNQNVTGITTSIGLYGMQRRGATDKRTWKNGTQISATATTPSTGLPAQSIWACGANGLHFHTGRVQFLALGASLSGLEAQFHTDVAAYMTAVGA